ncbi:MAG: hypothetical protein PHR19_02350 [Bacteroidales bacterium]|nr:hypothetical protein [Bacteroidales bacterium]
MAFEKGKPRAAGAGRKKGVTNGDTAKLRGLILGALDSKGGQGWLEQQMDEQPVAFMSMIAKCIPKEIEANVKSSVILTLSKTDAEL